MNFNLKKIDELIASNAKLAELLGRKEEPEKKACRAIVWVLAIIGAVAAIAAIAYAVYRYMNPEYFDDLDFDDFDDDEVDDFEEEDDIEAEYVTVKPAEEAESVEETAETN